jgi:predicted enzyme related to lactoylglutathione lyase
MDEKKRTHHTVDYVEFMAPNVSDSKNFYSKAFGWTFVDYGPDYAAFDQNLDGGFSKEAPSQRGVPLVILYSTALEDSQKKVEAAGGKIVKPIFSFPGGRRFHFADPAGNELAIWSDK